MAWVHRDDRFGEKLATPDTSIADLIGEVDPIKVAEGRYLSDELTLHYGLVPRTNRGIFAINELPDLAERIQVGLLNVLEERDVQVRGYKIRLPLDVMLVASANPEDYTNRGRIITPLKDRFGSQIRTHYPLEVETEIDIVRQEARATSVGRDRRARARLPGRGDRHDQPPGSGEHPRQPAQRRQRPPLGDQLRGARRQRPAAWLCAPASGWSCRASTTSMPWPPARAGKIEIESLDEGREGAIFENIVKSAVLTVFKARVAPERTREIIAAFEEGVDRPHRRGRPVDRPGPAGRDRAGAPTGRRRARRRRRVARRRRRGGVVRARGPAPLEAAQQGRLRLARGRRYRAPELMLALARPACAGIPIREEGR